MKRGEKIWRRERGKKGKGREETTEPFMTCTCTYTPLFNLPLSPLQNEVTEEEQRWGSKTVEGSADRAGSIRYVCALC